MEFSYTLDKTKDCILDTEGKLQDLIHAVLDRENGPGWESDPNISWGKDKRKELERRLSRKEEQFYSHVKSQRPIDYCYLLDLKQLLIKNERLFRPIFRQWEEDLGMFDLIGPLRDKAMHPHEISVHEQHLCLGICGRLLEIIDAWDQGRFRTVKTYAITLNWMDPSDGDKAIAEAQSWLDRIKTMTSSPVISSKIEGKGDAEIITFKEGTVTMTKPYSGPSTPPAASMHVETDSSKVLDRILSVPGHQGYWVLEWLMPDSLDVSKLVTRVDQLRAVDGRYQKTPLHHDPKSEFYIESAEYTLLRDSEWWVTLRIIGGNSPEGSKFTLITQYSQAGNVFHKAHAVFNPDNLLAFVYGEKGIREFRLLLKEAQRPSISEQVLQP